MYGTNAMQLRQSAPQCTWLTMVREPVEMLVSSVYYCRNTVRALSSDRPYTPAHAFPSQVDQLCVNHVHASSSSRSWARNHTLREWALRRPSVLFWTLALNPRWHARLSSARLPGISSVGIWNLQARAYSAAPEGELLKLVHLMAAEIRNDRLFSAFGLTERWNLSMRAFDAAVPLRGTDWAGLSAQHRASHGSARWAEEEQRALREARLDPEIHKALWIDRLLYAAFVDAFPQMLARLGVQ